MRNTGVHDDSLRGEARKRNNRYVKSCHSDGRTYVAGKNVALATCGKAPQLGLDSARSMPLREEGRNFKRGKGGERNQKEKKGTAFGG